MGRYARETSVSSDRTLAEIGKTVAKYGATDFMFMTGRDKAAVVFIMRKRRIRFILPLPDPTTEEFVKNGKGRFRKPEIAAAAWEQACRSSWRSLLLSIKAKLETVESGIAQFDDEFLAYIDLPGGQTIGQAMAPQLDYIYKTGNVPALEYKG